MTVSLETPTMTIPKIVEFFVRVSDTTSGMTFRNVTLDFMQERAEKITTSGNVKFYQYRNPTTGERHSWKAGRGWKVDPAVRDSKGRFLPNHAK